MTPQPELAVAEQLRAAIPGVNITCSHQIGRLGLLERENAALLNAALLKFAARVVSAFGDALQQRGLNCRFFVSQNDGTLMDAKFVRQFPALTFASGPTNSLRGACKLTGLDNAIVVDIGGTTSDIGILQDGFPRESNIVIEVGGVRTNFRMPDILPLGLGGGSLVAADGKVIGPQSVGHNLVTQGLAFGGSTLTATDLLVAAGKIDLGPAQCPVNLDPETIRNGLETIQNMLNQGIEKMMPSSDPLPVVLVGGGAVLVSEKLTAASQMHCPEHSGVANAIGAAIAQIGGETERLVSYRELPREEAIRQVSDQARAIAIGAGADATTIRIADIEETTISYMAEGSTRLRIKAVGDIAHQQREG
jgi:N-methylhydantoinase A/oxoprolinase/acetone carboxylase beta subunit